MTEVQGYKIISDKLRGGTSTAYFAEKNGKRYFLKLLDFPKYPKSGIFSPEETARKIAECEKWLAGRNRLINEMPQTSEGSNIVKPYEYFLDGTRYYEVTEKVETDSIECEDMYKESVEDRAFALMTVARALYQIHDKGIIHGDLDPGNILISRSATGKLVTKLIDFTSSFFLDDIPPTITTKPEYCSPEFLLYNEDPDEYRTYITPKADVFSLGVVLYRYCTEGGTFPDHGEYEATADALIQGYHDEYPIPDEVPDQFKPLIRNMLKYEPDERPTMEEVFIQLRDIANVKREPSRPPVVPPDPVHPEPSDVPSVPSHPDWIPGSGKKGGLSVVQVSPAKNPKKIRIHYSDGSSQVIDISVALSLRYIAAKS